jgi:TolB protein
MYGDGSGLSRLTFLEPVDEHAAPSSDGSRIAFDSTRDQANAQIYVMNVDGSNVRRLTTSPAVDRAPNWSSDTHRIAFESNRDGSFQIWTMNSDGSDARQLTKGSENHFPSWSWDNTRIVFVSLRDGHEVYAMNADGSNQKRLTSTPNNGASGHPTWSRDSSRIAFESNRTGNYEIYVMNSDGSNVKQITNAQSLTPVPPNTPTPRKQNRFPYWVPSCDERIAFSSNRQDPDYRIWITQPDGSNQRRLAYERPGLLMSPNAPDEHPAWSGAPANLPLFSQVLPAPASTTTTNRSAQLAPNASSTIPVTGSNAQPTVPSSADSTSSSPSAGVDSSPGTPPPSNNGFFEWLSSLWNWITHR